MEVTAPDVAGLYRRFAEHEARGSSPTYERLCRAVADDADAVAFVCTLPRAKRQPNLVLGALRRHGAPVDDPQATLAFLRRHADDVRATVLAHATQTNEPARCAVLLPALALLPGPLALLEIGSSAGLCLLPDRYRYRYRREEEPDQLVGDANDGDVDGALEIGCDVAGPVPLPERVPRVVARLGLDPNPLDASDPDVADWLRCLVWPEHTERVQRLTRALALAAQDPPPVVRGCAPGDVPGAVARLRTRAPGATVVVVHSAAVAYLEGPDRVRTAEVCRELGVHRVGLEGHEVTASTGVPVPDGVRPGRFLLSLDDRVLGHAHPHGRDLVWNS